MASGQEREPRKIPLSVNPAQVSSSPRVSWMKLRLEIPVSNFQRQFAQCWVLPSSRFASASAPHGFQQWLHLHGLALRASLPLEAMKDGQQNVSEAPEPQFPHFCNRGIAFTSLRLRSVLMQIPKALWDLEMSQSDKAPLCI